MDSRNHAKNTKGGNPGLTRKRRAALLHRVRGTMGALRFAMHERSNPHGGTQPRNLGATVLLLCLAVVVLGVTGSIAVTAHLRANRLQVVVDDGRSVQTLHTTARTVSDLLNDGLISLGPYDTVTPPLNARLHHDDCVRIARAMVVFVTSMDETRQIYLTEGTVEDALRKAGVEFDSDDRVTPDLQEKLLPGLRIRHVKLETRVVEEYYTIPYDTVVKKSSTLALGKEVLQTKGVNGTRTRQIRISYENEEEIAREQISEVISRQPVTRVVLEGTYVPPSQPPRPSSTKQPGATRPAQHTAEPSDRPGSSKPPHSDVDPADLVVPERPATFQEIMTMEVTAYTHAGVRCATGVWPRFSRSRANPGTVAIDTSVLGYGWLVYIPGYGYAVTEDCGVIGMKMDVFMNTENECNRWGRRRNVEVLIIGPYEGPSRK